MAALWDRNRAQGNSDKQRSMVVESKAYTVLSRSKPSGSLAYRGRARCRHRAGLTMSQPLDPLKTLENPRNL